MGVRISRCLEALQPTSASLNGVDWLSLWREKPCLKPLSQTSLLPSWNVQISQKLCRGYSFLLWMQIKLLVIYQFWPGLWKASLKNHIKLNNSSTQVILPLLTLTDRSQGGGWLVFWMNTQSRACLAGRHRDGELGKVAMRWERLCIWSLSWAAFLKPPQ